MPEVIDAPPVVSAEDLEALLDGDGAGLWHIVLRRNGITAICGAKCDRNDRKPVGASDDEDCKVCERILAGYLGGGGWEGSGRRPGREFTEELRWEFGDP